MYLLKDEFYMREALKEAKKAYKKGEIPVGCVIVKNEEIISRAHNLKEKYKDSTSHAEILAIKKASKKLESWRLTDCDIFVTLEPCPMCAGAILQSRVKRLIFGAYDEKTGAVGSKLNLLKDYKFNHEVKVESKVLEDECKTLLKEFFKELRK